MSANCVIGKFTEYRNIFLDIFLNLNEARFMCMVLIALKPKTRNSQRANEYFASEFCLKRKLEFCQLKYKLKFEEI